MRGVDHDDPESAGRAETLSAPASSPRTAAEPGWRATRDDTLRRRPGTSAAMRDSIVRFILFWGVNTLALWVTDQVFTGVRADSATALFAAGLLFGLANAVLRPVLVLVTLPITILTLGLFLLAINGLMLMLTAFLVSGFQVDGFGTSILAALFIALFSYAVNQLLRRGIRGQDGI